MQDVFESFATAAFGMEGLVAAELRRLGCADVKTENGGVRFQATLEELFLCNLRLRFCDRIMIVLAEGICKSFEALFQLTSGVAWHHLMAGTEAVLVSARCARSQLMSPRDCQSIVKKAILEQLKGATGRKVFPENGSDFPVLISIHEDRARILLNTSGDALSRRGYRTWNGEAPLRETIASALVELSPWRPGMALYDPCCGTGTILIEAAFRAAHRAPGLYRHFVMENFVFAKQTPFQTIRNRCVQETDLERISEIAGSDLDPEALELARRHAKQAGLGDRISFTQKRLQEVTLSPKQGVFLCNPPYGERLGDREQCRALYRDLHALQTRHPGWSLCAISSDPGFERAYGKKAVRRRRLYNGRLECTFYVY